MSAALLLQNQDIILKNKKPHWDLELWVQYLDNCSKLNQYQCSINCLQIMMHCSSKRGRECLKDDRFVGMNKHYLWPAADISWADTLLSLSQSRLLEWLYHLKDNPLLGMHHQNVYLWQGHWDLQLLNNIVKMRHDWKTTESKCVACFFITFILVIYFYFILFLFLFTSIFFQNCKHIEIL